LDHKEAIQEFYPFLMLKYLRFSSKTPKMTPLDLIDISNSQIPYYKPKLHMNFNIYNSHIIQIKLSKLLYFT